MAKRIEIVPYTNDYKEKWDKFIVKSSNGNFLHSRQFLDYHPAERFKDSSLLFMNGGNIVAVLPANTVSEDKKILYSHQGSTFGGLVMPKQFMKISYLDLIFEKLEEYLKENEYDEIVMKTPGRIYQNDESELLDYYYFLNGYTVSQEVGYFVDYSNYNDDIITNFSSSRRRDYKYSLKNEFVFKELSTQSEISDFYRVLCDNYIKFGKKPVHTLDELLDFRFSRLVQNVGFYGVYSDEVLIAGGMVFKFESLVFHTQYLAVQQDKTNLFANEFLYKSLIDTAKSEGFKYMSFGTSTFDGGKVLNRSLAQYKEGFGTCEYVNRTYKKKMK